MRGCNKTFPPVAISVENFVKPTFHLLCGRIGSGKTTFARKLEQENNAIRFTHDEWIVNLYGPNPPESSYGEYFVRVENLIWETAEAAIRAGADVILDFGFWTRASRDLARKRARAAGADVIFYGLSCPRQIALNRTLERSKNPPRNSLWIDRAAYEKLDALFEPMQDDEEFVSVQGESP
jgi:predicted kinase